MPPSSTPNIVARVALGIVGVEVAREQVDNGASASLQLVVVMLDEAPVFAHEHTRVTDAPGSDSMSNSSTT